jgi:hypothetical protein
VARDADRAVRAEARGAICVGSVLGVEGVLCPNPEVAFDLVQRYSRGSIHGREGRRAGRGGSRTNDRIQNGPWQGVSTRPGATSFAATLLGRVKAACATGPPRCPPSRLYS